MKMTVTQVTRARQQLIDSTRNLEIKIWRKLGKRSPMFLQILCQTPEVVIVFLIIQARMLILIDIAFGNHFLNSLTRSMLLSNY